MCGIKFNISRNFRIIEYVECGILLQSAEMWMARGSQKSRHKNRDVIGVS